MEQPASTPKGSVKRLLVPLGLLALYPLLILVLQLADAPAPKELGVRLTVAAETLQSSRAGVTVVVHNSEPKPLELGLMMINVIRDEEPERSLIEDRLGLARRLEGEPVIAAESSVSLGSFAIDLPGPPSESVVIQVSLNVLDPRTGEPRHVTREVPLAESAASG
jgi:hypothetical protein